MLKISEKSKRFIEKHVLGKLKYDEINDDNIAVIIDFIIDNYEVPLSQAKEAGEIINEDMLKAATDVVTEITTNPEW